MKKLTLLLMCFIMSMGLAVAQNLQITGVVVDEAGEFIVGASVRVVGASGIGASTDVNGKFSLSVPRSAKTLHVTFLGMEDVNVSISENMRIVMKESAQALEEVVVIGYGTGRNVNTVVGSAVKVSSKAIETKPVANVVDALQGKVAGLQVYTSSGEPSAVSSLRLHGVGSLGASNTPLYVVDGFPVDASTVLTMNPNDFESVTVLKDASSTSIYGSRGANGVVYIVTKRGTVYNEPRVTVRGMYGFSSLANTDFYDSMMTSRELTDFWVKTGYYTRANADNLLKTYPYDTRWRDVYYLDNTPTYQTEMSIQGGGGKTNYFISGSYFSQEGIAYRSSYERYTLRSNIDSQVNKWLKFGLNLSGSYDMRELNGYTFQASNSTNGGLFWLAQPFFTPNDPKTGEQYDYIPGLNRYHPEYLADKQPMDRNTANVVGSLFVDITPYKGLTIHSQGGMDARDYRNTAKRYPSFLASLDNGSVTESFYRNIIKTITNTIEYKFQLNEGMHNFTLLAGQEGVEGIYSDFQASSTGQTDDRLMELQHGPSNKTASQITGDTPREEYAYLSFFGRIEYAFKDKYSFEVNVRNDQSSRFGQDNRSAMFYSGGALWDMKKEGFLEGVDFLSTLTLRASIGSQGNSSIGNYLHLATIGTNQYNGKVGWGIESAGNSLLGWESQTKFSAGVKAVFLKNYSLGIEFYNRATKNQLMDVPYPFTSGFNQIKTNVGNVQNRGVDVMLDLDFIRTRDAFVNFNLNFNYNTQKITELFLGLNEWIVPNTGVTYVVGKPVEFYFPIYAGVDPKDGKQMWYKAGEDISVTTKNETTKTFNSAALEQSTGKPRYAPIAGGFGMSGGWKGISLIANFSYAYDKYLINNDRYFSENPSNFAGMNTSNRMERIWLKEGDVTDVPKWGEVRQFDTHLLENASFLRLKDLTLSYNLPTSLLKKTNFFKNVRVYATGRNLLTFTDYLGPDPEVDSNLTYGVYPNTKQFSFGIDVTF